ncbi:MAG: 50S ribosomal protein L25/general stress protein Ctc [Leptospiraceae bacterium]|nr:50S ribosomal protein L25/general stress protein Ctc [Leptospiraceae bacterium]MCK6379985.1 50S ribosomal protein L25/general stress protein Ctc [Leptospiraceae bacterium]NUM40172.1 50S ribosomal protein L25/general stress protein Ctc [Leptospiraceae bacterium]
MSKLTIKAIKKTETGKNANNRLRASGRVPVNIIGGGKSTPASMVETELDHLLASGIRQATLFELDIDGASSNVYVKDIQRFPGTNKVRHIDFYQVTPGKKVVAKVNILTTGIAKGSKSGGQFEHLIHELKVKMTPEEMKDTITLDVTDLEIGDSIKVSQLQIPKSWEVLINGDPIITSVNVTRALIAAEKTESKGSDTKAPAGAADKPAAKAPAAKKK